MESSFCYTFRKEGHTKIIEYDLTRKQKNFHDALEIRRPKVLSSIPTRDSPGQGSNQGDSDVEMSDVELERGESVMTDEEEEEGQNDQPAKSASGKIKGARGRNERVVAPEEVRAHLRRLYANEAVMCSLLFGRHGPFAKLSKEGYSLASADMFFMEVIPVTPTRFRLPAKLGETLFEHPQNELLARILNTSYRLRDLNGELNAVSVKSAEYDEGMRRSVLQNLLNTLVQLQIDVNSLIDSSKNPQPVRQGKLPPAGVKQGLEKKEGLFRKNMMVCHSEPFRSGTDIDTLKGQTSQLCRSFGHFARRQHRTKRNWNTTRLCSQTDVPRARDPRKSGETTTICHQRARPLPWREDDRIRRRSTPITCENSRLFRLVKITDDFFVG